MRIVVGTGVFPSAAPKDKSFPDLGPHVAAQGGALVKSTATEQQLFEGLARPQIAGPIEEAAADWTGKLLATAEAVVIAERIGPEHGS